METAYSDVDSRSSAGSVLLLSAMAPRRFVLGALAGAIRRVGQIAISTFAAIFRRIEVSYRGFDGRMPML